MTYSDFEAQWFDGFDMLRYSTTDTPKGGTHQPNKLFEVEDLHDGIHVIRDFVGVQMYLIEGDEKAALLDTGIGIGNVRPVVDAITDKSVEVYLTHGHVDHAGGIYGFDKVRVSALDRELLKRHTTRDFRLDFASAYFPELLQVDGLKEHLQEGGTDIDTVASGDVVELGGRRLIAVDMKGHTQGSLGYFDDKTQTLFAGDGCNNSTFLFLEESSSVAEYRDMLMALKGAWGARIKRMMICHGRTDVPLSTIDDVIDCCDMVLNGSAYGTQYEIPFKPFRNGHTRWAASGAENRLNLDGHFGNLLYDDRKIRL